MTKSITGSSRGAISTKSRFRSFEKCFGKANAVMIADNRAAVLVDQKNQMQAVAFDIRAFWEFCCQIDEYIFEETGSGGPTGDFIDDIEMQWDIKKPEQELLKKAFNEAKTALEENNLVTLK